MVFLGIDPGYATVGFGALQYEAGRFHVLGYGAVTTGPEKRFSERLYEVHQDMLSLIDRFRPDAMAVEELFFHSNQKTVIQVGQARGVILLAAEIRGCPLYEYTPLQVKQAVVGYGRAEKRQVMDMVRRLLAMNSVPKPDDAADALAIALCHARSATSILNNGGSVCSTI